MIRRPPRSTLFPTRRSSDLERRGQSTGMPDDEMIGSVPSDPTLRQTIEHRSQIHSGEIYMIFPPGLLGKPVLHAGAHRQKIALCQSVMVLLHPPARATPRLEIPF